MSRKAKDAIVITIDGPSASGKGTVARLVARRLGVRFMDTGSIYRAFALFARQNGVKPEEKEKIVRLLGEAEISSVNTEKGEHAVVLNGRDVSAIIRTPEISESASRFSEIKEVRETLGRIQRAHANNTGIVAEGRDMGTKVFRDADHKFFLTAEPEERARRRNSELRETGTVQTFEETAAGMASRDLRDTGRNLSPLQPAEDAVIIDTTHLGVDEVVEKILGFVEG